MELRVKTAWSELRLPLTRPLYSGGPDNNTLLLSCSLTSIPLVLKSLIPLSFSPHCISPTLPEKLQVKFTEDPAKLLTVLPLYGDVNCKRPSTEQTKDFLNLYFIIIIIIFCLTALIFQGQHFTINPEVKVN